MKVEQHGGRAGAGQGGILPSGRLELVRKLRQRNYTGKIVVARDGQEALAMTAKEKFDLIITDHRMPHSGGVDVPSSHGQPIETSHLKPVSSPGSCRGWLSELGLTE